MPPSSTAPARKTKWMTTRQNTTRSSCCEMRMKTESRSIDEIATIAVATLIFRFEWSVRETQRISCWSASPCRRSTRLSQEERATITTSEATRA
jgi:hypothetical protein